MAVPSSENNMNEYGIIILGNAGAGKSYLCNLLLGEQRFRSANAVDAVTTETTYWTLQMISERIHIYDIPGLIEPDQSAIERNKREIEKAFKQAPNSVVLFVWTNISGRVQMSDGVAFNAILNAYDIKTTSIIFVVNQIPDEVEDDYQEKFIARLRTIIKSMEFKTNDVLFIKKMKSDEKQLREDTRLKLFNLIKNHPPQLQKKKGPIHLEADKVEELEKQLMKQIQAAEKDRAAFKQRLEAIKEENERAKELADREMQLLRAAMAKEPEGGFFTHLGGQLAAVTAASVATPIAAVATPIAAAAGGISGGVRGAVSGFNTMVEPFADYLNDSDNPVVLRAAAAPVAVVSGAIGVVGGATVGAVEGTVKGIGRAFRSVFGK